MPQRSECYQQHLTRVVSFIPYTYWNKLLISKLGRPSYLPFEAAEYWKAAREQPKGARKGCARSASAQGGAVGEPRAA